MTTLLFNVLAATSLAVAGTGGPGETRSAQSLPNENLVVASPNAAATGKLHTVNRLADASPDNPGSDQMDKIKCEHRGGHWDEEKRRCRRAAIWPLPIIGAATLGGLFYALGTHQATPNQKPISN